MPGSKAILLFSILYRGIIFMKRLRTIKAIQLAVHALLAFAGVYCILQPEEARITAVICVFIAESFLFLLTDFYIIKAELLNIAQSQETAYLDPVSGLPGRAGCDKMIEKYTERTLPDHIGCVMLDLTNLSEINLLYNHAAGNELLKLFGQILLNSCATPGFIGRNGANKYLAVFENCSRENLNAFLSAVNDKVGEHNQRPGLAPIEYEAGYALNDEEHLSQITALISLANRRIYPNAEK